MSGQPQKKDNTMLLALLLFLGAGGLLFAYLGAEDKAPQNRGPSATAQSAQFEKSVNRHLMFTNENIEQRKQRMALENAQLLNKDFNSTKAQEAYRPDDRLDLSMDNRAADIAEELGRGNRARSDFSPHDQVQKELYQSEREEEYSQAYREEYARQFVENARRGGYRVILSDDLTKVISVTPIRQQQHTGGGFQLVQ